MVHIDDIKELSENEISAVNGGIIPAIIAVAAVVTIISGAYSLGEATGKTIANTDGK